MWMILRRERMKDKQKILQMSKFQFLWKQLIDKQMSPVTLENVNVNDENKTKY